MTNAHNLSVITNLCVTSPNNMKCDHSFNNCNCKPIMIHTDLNNEIFNNEDISNHPAYLNKTKAVRFSNQDSITCDLEELNGLRGEFFLSKLNELKDNHRLSMEISEHRYMDKVSNIYNHIHD